MGGQLDLFAEGFDDLDELPPDESDDDPLVKLPIIHRTVPAAERSMPVTSGASSVFARGAILAVQQMAAEARARRKAEGTPGEAKPLYRVVRKAGVTQCERILPQETEEWAERERARRARQRPPKPTKAARTKGAKLLGMIGGGNG